MPFVDVSPGAGPRQLRLLLMHQPRCFSRQLLGERLMTPAESLLAFAGRVQSGRSPARVTQVTSAPAEPRVGMAGGFTDCVRLTPEVALRPPAMHVPCIPQLPTSLLPIYPLSVVDVEVQTLDLAGPPACLDGS